MAQEYVDRMMEEKESSGGVIECRITDFNSLNSTYRDKRFRKISIKLFKYRIAKASWNTCDAA